MPLARPCCSAAASYRTLAPIRERLPLRPRRRGSRTATMRAPAPLTNPVADAKGSNPVTTAAIAMRGPKRSANHPRDMRREHSQEQTHRTRDPSPSRKGPDPSHQALGCRDRRPVEVHDPGKRRTESTTKMTPARLTPRHLLPLAVLAIALCCAAATPHPYGRRIAGCPSQEPNSPPDHRVLARLAKRVCHPDPNAPPPAARGCTRPPYS